MKQVDRQRPSFIVIAEDVGVVALFGGGDALLFLELVDRPQLVAQPRGGLELLRLGGGQHPRAQRALQLGMAAFQKKLRVLDGGGVSLGGGQALHARAQAAMDVVLQAGPGMVAGQIDLATGDEKAAVDQLHDPVGQVPGKVGAVIGRAVLAQPAGDKNFSKAVPQRQLHVGVRLVVPQQDIEAGMALLDEVVFQSQRLVLVGHQDVVQVHRLAHQRAGLGVGLGGFKQVRANPRTQVLGLAHIDHLALGVFVEIHAGLGRQGADFLVKVHGGCART